ncbi:hypothetical protein Cgig2_000756 [Carnegiea gigantea]|uniref:Uncharacterized protein n=1 Tax=Carnegiea gigantea TaxID=171969 RepID=A0A9Q1Q4V7_9CARY|nr:hypothetical protein Cgig2_000756 [Carnegiea gigantea]
MGLFSDSVSVDLRDGSNDSHQISVDRGSWEFFAVGGGFTSLGCFQGTENGGGGCRGHDIKSPRKELGAPFPSYGVERQVERRKVQPSSGSDRILRFLSPQDVDSAESISLDSGAVKCQMRLELGSPFAVLITLLSWLGINASAKVYSIEFPDGVQLAAPVAVRAKLTKRKIRFSRTNLSTTILLTRKGSHGSLRRQDLQGFAWFLKAPRIPAVY